MEKLKALIAVTLFVAALLFAMGNENTKQQDHSPKATQKVIIDKW